MAASKHLTIRDAVAALLTSLAGGRVYENRDLALEADVASQIQVFRVRSTPDRSLVSTSAPVDWITQLRIVVKARTSGGSSAEVVADGLAGSVYAALMADQTLGGLVGLVDPGDFAWDQDEADTAVAVATWDLSVQHRTSGNVIT